MARPLSLPLIVVSAVLLVGCGDGKPDAFDKHKAKQKQEAEERAKRDGTLDERGVAREWVEEHTPEARARLERIEALAKVVDVQPPVLAPELLTDPGEAIELSEKEPGFNAGELVAVELLRPCSELPRATPWEPAEGGGQLGLGSLPPGFMAWIGQGACLALSERPEVDSRNAMELRRIYERLLQPTYAVVLRVHEFEAGKVIRAATKDKDGKFEGSVVRGDVLLYRIEDASYLAGFPVVAGNTDEFVRATKVDDGDIIEDAINNFQGAMHEVLRVNLPGYVNHHPTPVEP